MATIRQTTYRCDVCGEKVDKKSDLVSIRAEKGIHSRYYDEHRISGVKADFCASCEEELLLALGPFYGYDAIVEQLRRPEPKKAKDGKRDEATEQA